MTLLRHSAVAFAATLFVSAHASTSESITGRPIPTVRGDFSEVKPSLRPLLDCAQEVEREAREQASTKMGPPSAAARAQKRQECEGRNAQIKELNAAEVERSAKVNAARQADSSKANAQQAEDRAVFDAEEAEVGRIVAAWTPKLRAKRRPDAMVMLADNAHLLVGEQIIGPFRLVERLGPTSALVTSGRAVVKVENIPADTALFRDRSFVLLGDVTGIGETERYGSKVKVPVVTWTEGVDCSLQATPAHRRSTGCLPWMGLRNKLGLSH